MKNLILILLAIILAFSIAACGGENTTSSEGTSSEFPVSSSGASEVSSKPTEVIESSEMLSESEEHTEEEKEILVAYFSWSGNTRQIADIIAQETGADLFEIAPTTPYTDDYNALLDITQQEQSEDARPELDAQVENWDSYDMIFVGYPNWWSDAPMAVYTFLESYDFTDKTLIPFNTSASGGFGKSLTGISESAVGATILDGLELTEGELGEAQSLVTVWLDGIGLNG